MRWRMFKLMAVYGLLKNNFMNKKTAIVTGASGFIGSHCLEYFLEKTDWDIIAPSSWRHKGTPERITEIFKRHPEFESRVRVITHDLTAPFTDHTIETFGKVNYIINVASESHVVRSIESPVEFTKNNIDLTLNMLELARKVKPEMFIQVSTDEVYGSAPVGTRYKEWDAIVPSNPYSASKASQEALCISYWRTYDVPLVITNTVNNFGETQDQEKFLSLLIKKLHNDEEVVVHGNSNFIGGRFYIYVKNHADAILHIVNNIPVKYCEGEQDRPNRFNVTSDDELDNLEMAKLMARIMGKELKYKLEDFHVERKGHDRRYALDSAKLKETGWDMPFKFEESLKQYVKWTLENQQWI